jgi:hypothetical protein
MSLFTDSSKLGKWSNKPVITNNNNINNIIKKNKIEKRSHIAKNCSWPSEPFSKYKKFDESEGWYEYNSTKYQAYKKLYPQIWYKFSSDELKNVKQIATIQKSKNKSFTDSVRFMLYGFYDTYYYPDLNDECANCGSTKNITNEHIYPTSGGGANTPSNKCLTCHTCNDTKANKFRIDSFDINKVHPEFANKLKQFNISYDTLAVEEVMYILRILYKSYLTTCQRIFEAI